MTPVILRLSKYEIATVAVFTCLFGVNRAPSYSWTDKTPISESKSTSESCCARAFGGSTTFAFGLEPDTRGRYIHMHTGMSSPYVTW